LQSIHYPIVEKLDYTIVSLGLLIISLPFFSISVNDLVWAQVIDKKDNVQQSHTLLVNEIPAIQEDIDNLIAALDKGNYTLAKENIDEMESGVNWLNVKGELLTRNENNQLILFNSSMSKLNQLVIARDPSSILQVEHTKQEFEKIISILGIPLIDYQRLILTIVMTVVIVGLLLFIIPKIRRNLKIRY